MGYYCRIKTWGGGVLLISVARVGKKIEGKFISTRQGLFVQVVLWCQMFFLVLDMEYDVR